MNTIPCTPCASCFLLRALACSANLDLRIWVRTSWSAFRDRGWKTFSFFGFPPFLTCFGGAMIKGIEDLYVSATNSAQMCWVIDFRGGRKCWGIRLYWMLLLVFPRVQWLNIRQIRQVMWGAQVDASSTRRAFVPIFFERCGTCWQGRQLLPPNFPTSPQSIWLLSNTQTIKCSNLLRHRHPQDSSRLLPHKHRLLLSLVNTLLQRTTTRWNTPRPHIMWTLFHSTCSHHCSIVFRMRGSRRSAGNFWILGLMFAVSHFSRR